MAAPLWQMGVYSLTDLLAADGVRLASWTELQTACGDRACEAQRQALRGLQQVFCGAPAGDAEDQAQFLPHAGLPTRGTKLDHLTWVAAMATRTPPDDAMDGRTEYLIVWTPTLVTAGALHWLTFLGHIPDSKVAAGLNAQNEMEFRVTFPPSWETVTSLTAVRDPTRSLSATAVAALRTSVRELVMASSAQAVDTKMIIPAVLLPQPCLTISSEEVNPDVDIQPPHTPTVIVELDLVWAYLASGRCVGSHVHSWAPYHPCTGRRPPPAQ